MKEDKVIKLMKEMKIYKDDGNEFPVNYELYNTFWVEAQKERDEEIIQYILLTIHGDSSYPNEHLRKGLEFLKTKLPFITKELNEVSLENNLENTK